MKPGVGAIMVHVGNPPENNPYRTHSICGPLRAEALTAWAHGKDTSRYTFWSAPAAGGARRLNDPDEVNWETSDIERIRLI